MGTDMIRIDPAASGWPVDGAVGELLGRLPFPLALIGADGRMQFANAAFDTEFDAEALHGAREAHPLAWIARRDGRQVPAHVLPIDACEARLLIVEDRQDSGLHAALSSLQARVAELEAQSSTDCLTGAWNRLHFNKVIAAELDRSLRYKQPVSLILLDIDHFKRINDWHGHQAGDEVLHAFARLVSDNIRSADTLFRWGGEEFAVLATATGHRGAWALAESLRARIGQHVFPAAGSLTASLGVAEHVASECACDWFKRADMALYRAKRDGRNRTCASQIGNSDRWATGLSAVQLVWQEAYECGEPTIDREHRELFDLANGLIVKAFSRQEDQDSVVPALDRLIEHLVAHFGDEEALLEKHAYPGLDTHKRAHQALLNKGSSIRQAVDRGEERFGDLVEFLANEVVARHLFKMDRDFFPLFGRS